MLLNRKKLNHLTRVVAILMAAVFALTFLFLGVGSSSGVNVFAGCDKSTNSQSASIDQQEQALLDSINQNPQDKQSMFDLADLYANQSVGRYNDAITWYTNYLQLDPSNVDLRLKIANIYLNNLNDTASAIKVINDAAAVAPNNAQIYLRLGSAQQAAGQTQAAIDAWNKFLQLAPKDPNASAVQSQIGALQQQLANPPASATPAAPAAGGAPSDIPLPGTPATPAP